MEKTAMSEVTTLINNRMKPIIAMECSLPWDVVRMLDEREEDREFLGPFSVRENADHTQPDSKLFCVRFRCENQKIRVYLQSTQHPRTCDLLAAAHLIVTHRDTADCSDPKTWPLPNDIKDSFMFPAEGVKARILFSCCKSRLRCLTLRLQVYAYKPYPADSLIDFLNSSRKSGSLLCDIRLQVDGQDFPAHKAVLSASSCVFMAMFTADFKEKSSETIVIENVSKEAFGRFLEILYSDLDTGLVGYELELLELSERFQVAWLKDSCKMYMWDLDGPSALRILMQADKWPVVTPGLMKRLCQLVAASYRSLEDTDDWRALQASNPVASGFIQAFATAVTPPMVIHFNTVPPSGKISRKRPLSS